VSPLFSMESSKGGGPWIREKKLLGSRKGMEKITRKKLNFRRVWEGVPRGKK